MKVTLKDKEIMRYVLSVNIEEGGEQYAADISYDVYDGYEITFLNEKGQIIAYPQWAIKYEEDNLTGDSLGYWLEDQIGGWFKWEQNQEKVSA